MIKLILMFYSNIYTFTKQINSKLILKDEEIVMFVSSCVNDIDTSH